MPDEPMVKCAACGFLTLRNDYTGELDEVDSTFRQSGDPPARRRPDPPGRLEQSTDAIFDKPYLLMPICFVRAWNLFEEFNLGPNPGYATLAPDLVWKVITKPRPCANSESKLGFVKWEQGFTPKEHREMLDRERLLKLQFDREDADRLWRERQEEREHKWRKEDEVSELKWRIVQVVVFGGMGAGVAILAAIIGKS
mgnify:CR=1 FL=1